jgi:4-hydroxy-tetrahydrodipicolinate synthase
MIRARIEFKGCYTAIVTPFTADGGRVDATRLAEHIQFQAQGGVTGIVPCGTTGESPTLSEREHGEVVSTAVERGHALGLQVVAGAGSNSTAHAVHLQKLAHSLGADAGLQVTPYYNKPSQEGIYRHFMAVADSCDLPVMLYNIPGRSGVPILPETVERLAHHPNIRAIKEATGSMDSASEIRQRCGITLLSGDDSLTVAFAAVGAVGVVSVVSNLVPDRVSVLCRHTNANDFASARMAHDALFLLSRGLLGLDTNPVPVKAAMALLGRDSGMVRLPMAPASTAVVARIRELLREAGLEPAARPCPGPIAAGAAQ